MLNRLTLDGRDYSLVKLPDGFKIGDRPYVMLMGGQVFIMESVSEEPNLKNAAPPDEMIDWEVVSFQHNNKTFYKDGEVYRAVMPLIRAEPSLNISPVLNHVPPEAIIFSIKRLSDGQIFSIGETFTANAGCDLTIKKFEINRTDKNLVYVWSSVYGYWPLSDLKKKEKKLIFKTNDGVEYFEGQEGDGLCGLNIATWETTVAMVRFALTDYNNDWIFFSTKEAADEYVFNSKPCLSQTDIREFIMQQDIITTDQKSSLILNFRYFLNRYKCPTTAL